MKIDPSLYQTIDTLTENDITIEQCIVTVSPLCTTVVNGDIETNGLPITLKSNFFADCCAPSLILQEIVPNYEILL